VEEAGVLKITSCIDDAGRPLVVPVASLEQHGRLPLSSDLVIAECVASNLAGVCVAPAIPYSTALEHEVSIGTSPSTFIDYLSDVLVGLARLAPCIVVAVFHGGAVPAAILAVRQARRRTRTPIAVYDFWSHIASLLKLEGYAIHGGPIEASLLAACGVNVPGREARPDEVVDTAKQVYCRLPGGWIASDCPTAYEAPELVSRRLGERLVAEARGKLLELVRQLCGARL
jgi:creatinine amidohydrolase/Fe(II)-dependent formamide hydrolase-like protein